jgi:hypothetical protein
LTVVDTRVLSLKECGSEGLACGQHVAGRKCAETDEESGNRISDLIAVAKRPDEQLVSCGDGQQSVIIGYINADNCQMKPSTCWQSPVTGRRCVRGCGVRVSR